MDDPIVEKIRRIRSQIEKDFEDTPDTLLACIYEQQKKNGERLVSRRPRRITKNAPAS